MHSMCYLSTFPNSPSTCVFTAVIISLSQKKECHKLVLNNERETFDRIADLTEAYLQKSGIPSEKIIAIGISMPGLVDAVGGVNYTYLRFGRKTLLDSFEERFQKKVFLENDARAMTLAEFKFGPDHTHKNVLGVFVGWGIGLGIIIDGKIYRGASGFAGEFFPFSDLLKIEM